jgi:hypothetical protein
VHDPVLCTVALLIVFVAPGALGASGPVSRRILHACVIGVHATHTLGC